MILGKAETMQWIKVDGNGGIQRLKVFLKCENNIANNIEKL